MHVRCMEGVHVSQVNVIGAMFQSYMVTSQKYFGSCKHLSVMARCMDHGCCGMGSMESIYDCIFVQITFGKLFFSNPK